MHPEIDRACRLMLEAACAWVEDWGRLLAAGVPQTITALRMPRTAPAADHEQPEPDADDRDRAWDHQFLDALIGPDRQAIHLTEMRDLMRRDPAWADWDDEAFRRWLTGAGVPVRQVRVGTVAGRLGVHRRDLCPRLLALPLGPFPDPEPSPSPAALTCVDEGVEGAVEGAVDRAYLTDPGEEIAWP